MKAWNKKTHKIFLNELSEKGISYIPLEKYVDAKTKIDFKCDKCGTIWKSQPSNILIGRGCPKCKINNAKIRNTDSHETFVKKAKENNPNVEILSEYEGYKNKILVCCKKHNIKWWTVPSVILRGCGCHQCMNERIAEKNRRSHDEFLAISEKISPHIEILGKYKNAKTKIKARCKVHNEIYYVAPDLIVNGTGNCPKCTYTSGEYKVANYLDSKGYEYIYQYSFADTNEIRNKRFDFYIPSANTCIEYDGKQHFEPVKLFGGKDAFEYTKKNDEIKNKYCIDNHIALIRVPYTVNDVGKYLGLYGI